MPATVVNNHVSRLGRFLSFRSGDQVFEERADPGQLESIDTVAKAKLVSLAEDPATRLVVLTGDAGHGKTHLCRTALQRVLGIESAEEALQALNDRGDGAEPIGTVAGRDLYIVRDLSELRLMAVPRMREALCGEDRVTLVCANEGKLRAVVADSQGDLDVLRDTLEETQRTGRISIRPGVFVLDLNYQSVTAGEGGGFLQGLLKQWALDGRRWQVCAKCPSKARCPILQNRRMLAGDDDKELGGRRRDGLSLRRGPRSHFRKSSTRCSRISSTSWRASLGSSPFGSGWSS